MATRPSDGFYYMYIDVLPTYLCITCMPDACRGQSRAMDPLELGLQTVKSHFVGAGI